MDVNFGQQRVRGSALNSAPFWQGTGTAAFTFFQGVTTINPDVKGVRRFFLQRTNRPLCGITSFRQFRTDRPVLLQSTSLVTPFLKLCEEHE